MEEKIIYCENKSHDTYGKNSLEYSFVLFRLPSLRSLANGHECHEVNCVNYFATFADSFPPLYSEEILSPVFSRKTVPIKSILFLLKWQRENKNKKQKQLSDKIAEVV